MGIVSCRTKRRRQIFGAPNTVFDHFPMEISVFQVHNCKIFAPAARLLSQLMISIFGLNSVKKVLNSVNIRRDPPTPPMIQ